MSTFSLEVPGGWVTAIVLALGFLAAIALTLHKARAHAKERRWVLSALRIATAVLAWCVAVQPTRTRERADDDPGRLAVLLDTSRSMRVQTGGETRMARAAGLVASWRAEAEARGFYPPDTSILLNGWGKPIDFTNPDAAAWWEEQLGAYTRLGSS